MCAWCETGECEALMQAVGRRFTEAYGAQNSVSSGKDKGGGIIL